MVVLGASFSLITVLLFWLSSAMVQHWMLPNQGFRSLGRWLGFTLAGVIVGVLVLYSLVWFLFFVVPLDVLQNANHGFIFVAINVLVFVSVVVITQWLILRRRVTAARRWALAIGIGGTLIWALNLYLMVFLQVFIPAPQFSTLLIPLLLGSGLGWISGRGIATYDARFRRN